MTIRVQFMDLFCGLLFFVVFALFLLWAYLPESILHSAGITYYPSKWWALAIPTFMCTTWGFIVVTYFGYNLYSTNPLHSMATIRDEFSIPRKMSGVESSVVEDSTQIPPIYDVDIHNVCSILYGNASFERR
eukprot:382740_1